MSEAYVETTILADLLLKPNSSKQERAKAALARYERTLLPVYSIKEWKAGPLRTYAYVHNKLVQTRSLADTMNAISALSNRTNRKGTSMEALAGAGQVSKEQIQPKPRLTSDDKQDALTYQLSLKSLIMRSWRKRRKITSQVVHDLPCYTEVTPRIRRDGLFDLTPHDCDPDQECCLASELKANPGLLESLRDSIPKGSGRAENDKRRHALSGLIKHPNEILDRDTCRHLGDAIFAFFCPPDAVILTTNLRDHAPLASAAGKHVEGP